MPPSRKPPSRDPATARVSVLRVPPGDDQDLVAVEEPLEIRVATHDQERAAPLSVTMRTPGDDPALAVGFLHGEGLIARRDDLVSISSIGPPAPGTGQDNVVEIRLAPGVAWDPDRLQRHFYATSSCGVCGKRSIEALAIARRHDPGRSDFAIHPSDLLELPTRLRASQRVFGQTGALHAAASFDAGGSLHRVFEDVGRHNALDKLVGHRLLDGSLPLSDQGILVSGRASFELLQKALMAGCPLLVAVGAPSSLAVQLAREHGVALVGFLRSGRFNVYAGAERIAAHRRPARSG